MGGYMVGYSGGVCGGVWVVYGCYSGGVCIYIG